MSAPMDTGEDIVAHQMTLRPYINGILRDVHKRMDHNSMIFYNSNEQFYNPSDQFYSNIMTNNNDKINDDIITNNKNTITNINNIITNDYPSSSVFGNNVVIDFDDLPPPLVIDFDDLPPPPPPLANLRLRRVEYNNDESDDDMPPLAPPSEPQPISRRQCSSIDDHDLRPPPLSRTYARHNNSNVVSDEDIVIFYDNPEPDSKNNDNMFPPD